MQTKSTLHRTQIRLPHDLHKQIKMQAEESNRSFHGEMIYQLRQACGLVSKTGEGFKNEQHHQV